MQKRAQRNIASRPASAVLLSLALLLACAPGGTSIMCLAIPGKIVEFHQNYGVRMSKVDFGGIHFTPDQVSHIRTILSKANRNVLESAKVIE